MNGYQGVRHIFRPTRISQATITRRKMSQTPTRERLRSPRLQRPISTGNQAKSEDPASLRYKWHGPTRCISTQATGPGGHWQTPFPRPNPATGPVCRIAWRFRSLTRRARNPLLSKPAANPRVTRRVSEQFGVFGVFPRLRVGLRSKPAIAPRRFPRLPVRRYNIGLVPSGIPGGLLLVSSKNLQKE